MRRSSLALLLAALLGASLVTSPGSAGESASEAATFERVKGAGGPVHPEAGAAEGEVLVRFRSGVRRSAGRAAVRARVGVRRFAALEGLPRLDLVRLAPGESVGAAIQELERDPRVAAAQPNFRYTPLGHEGDPDDPLFHHLWGLRNDGQSHVLSSGGSGAGTIGADAKVWEAWNAGIPPPEGPIVAVVDTGVDHDHPDLFTNLWVNSDESGDGKETNLTDDDDNGCIDDVHGCNFTLAQPAGQPLFDPTDEEAAHGTHVAGTIAAVRNNGIGVAGVCPECRIMVVNAGRLRTTDIVEGLAYAGENGARVVNASWGCRCWDPLLYQAIADLRDRDPPVLFVAAAGNASWDNDIGYPAGREHPNFPSSHTLENVLAVAASTDTDRYAGFTSWGRRSVDIAAPGRDIVSTVPEGTGDIIGSGPDYEAWNGTSMAAPHVAGVAGLLLAATPTLSAVQVKNKILNAAGSGSFGTTPSLRGVTGKFTRTHGRLDALAALEASSVWNKTPNDGEIEGAERISTRKRGRVRQPNDVNDIYKKKLRKGRTYVIRLTVPKGRDFDLYLWKRGTKELWQRDKLARSSTRSTGRDEVVRIRPGGTGVFYIQAMAWYGSTGGYTLTVRRA